MELRKGFYFSFDAFLALAVISSSVFIAHQSNQINYDDFESNTIQYEKAGQVGNDLMQLSSEETFRTLSDDFKQELKGQTLMEEEDLDRTILDGISLLWAAGELDYAEETADRYFGLRIDDHEYQLIVDEPRELEENQFVISNSSEIPETPDAVSSVSRLVSGHSIDRPSEGFMARARAVEATTNQTKIVDIPMIGSGTYQNNMEIEEDFHIPSMEIHEATAYISMQWGQSNFDSASIDINDEDIISENDLQYLEDDGNAQYAFGEVDVTEELNDGWNQFFIEFPNQDSEGDYHAHVQPGMRIEVVYTEDNVKVRVGDWDYLTELYSEAQNPNRPSGVWYNHPIQVPQDSEIEEAVLELDIRDLEDHREDDLQIYLNDNLLHSQSAPINEKLEIDFSDELEHRTNVLSIYGNIELDGGEIIDFTHEGNLGEGPRIYSDPQNDEGSRVKVEYETETDGIEFGLIDITWTNEIGGNIEDPISIRQNPAEFEELFDEEFEIINTFLNPAQINSIDVEHRAEIDDEEVVYESPRNYTTPTRIETGEHLVEGGRTTSYYFEDACYDGLHREYCWLLPESSLEVELGIPSQVEYGQLFETESEAFDDAEQRLDEQLGQFAEATEIENDALSTGSQPYIWGPASVRLVVWDE